MFIILVVSNLICNCFFKVKKLTILILLIFNLGFCQTGYIEYKSYGPIYDVETNYRVKIDRIKVHKLDSLPLPVNIKKILYFNQNETSYKTTYQAEKIPISEIRSGSKTGGVTLSSSGLDSTGGQIYRNFKTKEIEFRVMKSLTDPYVVKDNWLEINWVIFDEFKEIEGYKVQKAAGYFRGRKYVVWFTKEIPYPYGPAKLFGLPGVILETYNPAHKTGLRAINICYPCDLNLKIEKPKEKIKRSIKEYVYYNDHPNLLFAKNVNKKMGEDSYILLKENTATLEDIKLKRLYSSEIQYEWEEFPGDTPEPKDLEENLIIVDKLEDYKEN